MLATRWWQVTMSLMKAWRLMGNKMVATHSWGKGDIYVNQTYIYRHLFNTLSAIPYWDHAKGENPEASIVIKEAVLMSKGVRGTYDCCRGECVHDNLFPISLGLEEL